MVRAPASAASWEHAGVGNVEGTSFGRSSTQGRPQGAEEQAQSPQEVARTLAGVGLRMTGIGRQSVPRKRHAVAEPKHKAPRWPGRDWPSPPRVSGLGSATAIDATEPHPNPSLVNPIPAAAPSELGAVFRTLCFGQQHSLDDPKWRRRGKERSPT